MEKQTEANQVDAPPQNTGNQGRANAFRKQATMKRSAAQVIEDNSDLALHIQSSLEEQKQLENY